MDAVVGTGELESILEAAGLARPAAAPSPFTILSTSHADSRAGQESRAGTHKQALAPTKSTGFSPYIDKPQKTAA